MPSSERAVWQLDFYRRPLKGRIGKDPLKGRSEKDPVKDSNHKDSDPLWELLICDEAMDFSYAEFCPQAQVGAPWLHQQLEKAKEKTGSWPAAIHIFRPQTLSLVEVACRQLPVTVEPKRAVPTLKRWLHQRAVWYATLENYSPENYSPDNPSGKPYLPTAIDRPAPQPIPDYVMGNSWQFAAVSPNDLQRLAQEPIPVQSVPDEIMPLNLGLPSTAAIPGVIIEGGRQSMSLAQWLHSVRPVMMQYIPGPPDGLLLEAGLSDRWILATFQDEQVAAAARTFTERKLAAQGLHFLLVRPDNSGMTYTGLWLLQSGPDKEIHPAQA